MLLALDTSTRNVGLALYNGVQVRAEMSWFSRDYHTVQLAPATAELLARAGVKPADLQALAVACGPGSFTGLRIGMALAKGIALVYRLPLIGVPTLDILAAGQPLRSGPLAVVLRAGRGRLAVGWYSAQSGSWQRQGDLMVLTALELNERIQSTTWVCGELEEEEQRLLARRKKLVYLASPAQAMRRPAVLAELAWARWKDGQVDDPRSLSPQYLHFNDPIPEAGA
jgi:tRNA threonylcarbamoyladenosine biosynthesis protein TsaB